MAPQSAPFIPEDIDEDCDVGFSDLLLLLAAWGPCEEAATVKDRLRTAFTARYTDAALRPEFSSTRSSITCTGT